MTAGSDLLWPYFVDLWNALGYQYKLTLIGGYAIALKQRWLLENSEEQTILAASSWPVARATLDMDMVIRIELLLDFDENSGIRSVINSMGWQPANRLGGRHWQFVRDVGNQTIKIEFQATNSPPAHLEYKLQERRIKPKKSMNGKGIHAFPSAQVTTSSENVSIVKLEMPNGTPGIEVRLAHPVNLVIQKINALDDFFGKAQQEEAKRKQAHLTRQAAKHANDVLLVLAMMTRQENDATEEVLIAAQKYDWFAKTREQWKRFFVPEGWAVQQASLSGQWQQEDLNQLVEIAEKWFK